MQGTATITYYLSEKGRRDSLRKGGDGKREQIRFVAMKTVKPDDVDGFSVDEEGRALLDARITPEKYEVNGAHVEHINKPAKDGSKVIELEWNLDPTMQDLVQFARFARESEERYWEEMYLEHERQQAEKEKVAQAFLADPKARAQRIDATQVTIADVVFYSHDHDHPAVVEARARAKRDEEEIQNAKRATLVKWINERGTENQRQRVVAGLLPWAEALASVEDYFYAPLKGFARYERFNPEHVCHCELNFEQPHCNVKFKSVDASVLDAEEWEQFAKIKAAVPDAVLQLRQHTAECESGVEPELRRGVIVKFTLGPLTLKREFALTSVQS